jgi:antitoxin component HigA of HigAB toxin-antitoxin module
MKNANPIDVLHEYVERFDTHGAAAKKLGISTSYLSDLLHGRRTFTTPMLNKLGLQRVVVERR